MTKNTGSKYKYLVIIFERSILLGRNYFFIAPFLYFQLLNKYTCYHRVHVRSFRFFVDLKCKYKVAQYWQKKNRSSLDHISVWRLLSGLTSKMVKHWYITSNSIKNYLIINRRFLSTKNQTYLKILYVIFMSRTSFRVNPHSKVCLNVKELLAQSRHLIRSLSESNEIRTHSHLVRKQTLSHLAKWLSIRLRTKWLLIRISLLSLIWK